MLKRWLAGTLHNGHSSAHLSYYLDEFTFRFNRRSSRSRGLLFYRLLQRAAHTDPHPLASLVAAPVPDRDCRTFDRGQDGLQDALELFE